MRKLLRGVLTLALFACVLVPSTARADRIINYSGENPASTDQNQKDRFVREAFGTFAMQLLGLTGSGAGAYGGLIVNPQTGMNVEVDVPSGAYGMLLQVEQADAAIPSSASPQLPTDSTNVMVPYFQKTNSGGLSVPAPGSNSIYYLIEAQGQTVDTENEIRLFVDSNGNRFNQAVDTIRADQITYQVKAGSSGISPTPPPSDTGWIGVATVLVPTGATNCSVSCTVIQTTHTIAAAVASTCSACVLTNSNATLATLGLDGNSAPAHGIEGGSGTQAFGLTSNTSGAAPYSWFINALNCGSSKMGEFFIAGVLKASIDCNGGYNVGSNSFGSAGLVTSAIQNSAVAGSGARLLCTDNSGNTVACDAGGTGGNFPAHGTVVLINSSDGCGGVTATFCAVMGSGCSANSDCGKVSVTSAAAAGACTDPILADFPVPGTADTTPLATAGFFAVPVANNATVHFEVHFYNFSGGSFGNTAGNVLAAGYTCLI